MASEDRYEVQYFDSAWGGWRAIDIYDDEGGRARFPDLAAAREVVTTATTTRKLRIFDLDREDLLLVIDKFKAHYAEQIKCIGDTDGDGNCPLSACPHCHPESFTDEQLRTLMYDQWPTRAVLMLCPTERIEGMEVATDWIIDNLHAEMDVLDPHDEHTFIRAQWTPIRDRRTLLSQIATMYEVYRSSAASRGIELPPDETESPEREALRKVRQVLHLNDVHEGIGQAVFIINEILGD